MTTSTKEYYDWKQSVFPDEMHNNREAKFAAWRKQGYDRQDMILLGLDMNNQSFKYRI